MVSTDLDDRRDHTDGGTGIEKDVRVPEPDHAAIVHVHGSEAQVLVDDIDGDRAFRELVHRSLGIGTGLELHDPVLDIH